MRNKDLIIIYLILSTLHESFRNRDSSGQEEHYLIKLSTVAIFEMEYDHEKRFKIKPEYVLNQTLGVLSEKLMSLTGLSAFSKNLASSSFERGSSPSGIFS